MAKVFLITDGCYSDYGVTAAFSTRELAEEMMAAMTPSDDRQIEEYDLDTGIEVLRAGCTRFQVRMLRDGTTERVDRFSPLSSESAPRVVERSKWNSALLRGPDYLAATVTAKDEAHAIKIVNEHRARIIAEGAWPEASRTR